ncbi:hypothetical protein RCH08_004012 [Janthinobacterium sp. CG_S6]|nr:hypothetical protein [Janthinobacterium sp. CG_S6]
MPSVRQAPCHGANAKMIGKKAMYCQALDDIIVCGGVYLE